jgi:predicted membrane chloride channel (bestrophin family)
MIIASIADMITYTQHNHNDYFFLLSLSIVFRTNTSYNRWDEARKFWGLNINHTRDLNRMAAAWYGNDSSPGSQSAPKETARVIDPKEREYLLGQVSLFTWAFVRSMKRHLSPPAEDEEDYIAELKSSGLTPEQADAIISATHRPNRALYDLSVAIEKLPMHFMRKNEINKNLSIFEDTLGGSERLLSSPVPLFYSRHTARFISVWLLFLPFALYSQFGDSWNHVTMIPATALISLFLFGIEELATQLEEPFTILPMQGFCDKIGANCKEIAGWAGQDNFVLPEEVMEQMEMKRKLDLEEAKKSEMADAKKAMEASIVDETKLESVSKENDSAQSSACEVVSGDGNMEQMILAIQSEKDDLASKLEEANEKLRTAEASKEKMISNVEAAMAEKDGVWKEMLKMESEHNAKLSELSAEIEQHKDRITVLTSELNTVTSNHDDAMSKMEKVKIERDTLQTRVDELLSGSTNSQEVLLALGAEKEALSAQLEEATSQLKAKDTEISGLAYKVESLVNDLNALKSEKTGLQLQLEKATASYKALEAELEESSSTLKSVMAEKETLASNIKALIAELTEKSAEESAELEGNQDVTPALERPEVKMEQMEDPEVKVEVIEELSPNPNVVEKELERPEIKMEEDAKKTRRPKSLRELVQGL